MDYFESDGGAVTRVWKGARPRGVDRSRLTRARPGTVAPGMQHVGHQVIDASRAVTPEMVDAEAARRVADTYPHYLQEAIRSTGGRDQKRMISWLEAIDECALTLKAGRPIPNDYQLDYWWRLRDPRRAKAIAARDAGEQAIERVVATATSAIQEKVRNLAMTEDVSQFKAEIRDIQKQIELLNLFTRAQYAADKNVSGYRWENPDRDFAWDTGDGVPKPMDAHDFTEWAYVELSRLRG